MTSSSKNRVVTVKPPAIVHTALASVTHALSHIELIGGDISEATGDTASRTVTPTAPPVSPPTTAPTVTAGADIDAPVAEVPAMSAMPAMGVADAEIARPMHVRLKARVTAAHRPRRDTRATARATDVGTRER